jgi:hypothetical protein|tara:strand:- start:253 stop:1041 length:789 start_codon:yes stop_codon:yes gene_type:complete
MAYLPKNKYQVLYTNGGEYKFLNSQTPYIGNYLKLYNGEIFAGDSISSPQGKLIPITSLPSRNVQIDSINNRVYSVLKPNLTKEQDEYIPIIGSTPYPTEVDYKKGFFIRFFSVRLNTKSYQEIDKNTFLNFYKRKYNRKLYKVFQLKWYLGEDSEVKNQNFLRIYESKLPGISNMFPNNTQYRRNNPTNSEILESLIANQGELFYLDGSPYPEGALYHIHPIKGPMEGATHIPEVHASLSYSSIPGFPSDDTSSSNGGSGY